MASMESQPSHHYGFKGDVNFRTKYKKQFESHFLKHMEVKKWVEPIGKRCIREFIVKFIRKFGVAGSRKQVQHSDFEDHVRLDKNACSYLHDAKVWETIWSTFSGLVKKGCDGTCTECWPPNEQELRLTDESDSEEQSDEDDTSDAVVETHDDGGSVWVVEDILDHKLTSDVYDIDYLHYHLQWKDWNWDDHSPDHSDYWLKEADVFSPKLVRKYWRRMLEKDGPPNGRKYWRKVERDHMDRVRQHDRKVAELKRRRLRREKIRVPAYRYIPKPPPLPFAVMRARPSSSNSLHHDESDLSSDSDDCVCVSPPRKRPNQKEEKNYALLPASTPLGHHWDGFESSQFSNQNYALLPASTPLGHHWDGFESSQFSDQDFPSQPTERRCRVCRANEVIDLTGDSDDDRKRRQRTPDWDSDEFHVGGTTPTYG